MDIIESILGSIDGGRVLDVATKEGHFVQVLMKNLHSYSEIVGIDISEQAIETARNNLSQENVQFLVMNAEKLDFENKSFDTVNASASLHHLANIQQVLGEMERVLKPGGRFIIVEMHRDGQTEAELTSIYLHQWVAEVDSAQNCLHNRTLARQEIVDNVARIGLTKIECFDQRDTASDPKEKARTELLEGLIERTIQRAENTKNCTDLKEQGRELCKRLYKVGAQREPIIMIVGEK